VLGLAKKDEEKNDGVDAPKKQMRVAELSEGEMLMVNIGSTSTGARVQRCVDGKAGKLAQLVLTTPVCADMGEKMAISRRIDKRWRLIGWGKIVRGTPTQRVA